MSFLISINYCLSVVCDMSIIPRNMYTLQSYVIQYVQGYISQPQQLRKGFSETEHMGLPTF